MTTFRNDGEGRQYNNSGSGTQFNDPKKVVYKPKSTYKYYIETLYYGGQISQDPHGIAH